MNRPGSHEHHPHAIEIDGDVRHPDDDPELQPSADESSFEDLSNEAYYEELAETADLPLAVGLNEYREEQYLARAAYARAQRARGLEQHLAYQSDTRDLRKIEERRLDHIRVGNNHFKRAFGYEAMKAFAIAQGQDLEDFEHEFAMARNELMQTNRGRKGELTRRRLQKVILNSDSPTKNRIK